MPRHVSVRAAHGDVHSLCAQHVTARAWKHERASAGGGAAGVSTMGGADKSAAPDAIRAAAPRFTYIQKRR